MAFEKLDEMLNSLDRLGIPACDLIVYQDHRQVYRHYTGYRDEEKTRPVDGTEQYNFYSATKVYTCTAVMQLIEQGKLGLDDEVCRYLPSFKDMCVKEGNTLRPAKNRITIRNLMSMQSGLDYVKDTVAIKETLEKYGDRATTRQLVDAIARRPLLFEPGTDYKYSLSHDVLAAVVEVISGERFGEYLKHHIFEPLGITSLGFELTEEKKQKMCDQFCHSEDWGDPRVENIGKENVFVLSAAYESGGAGLVGDVEGYILLMDALACGGVGATGKQILKPETIDLFRTPQLCERGSAHFDRLPLGYGYALGVRTMMYPELYAAESSIGEFGWDGAAGAYALADPAKKISMFFAMHVLGCGFIYKVQHPRMRDLVYEELKRLQ